MVHGYKSGDRLLPIFRSLITYDTENTNFTKEADDFFRMFNMDDRPGGMTHRSLSVGDVVLFETSYGRVGLAVESIGFSPINVGLIIEHAVVTL